MQGTGSGDRALQKPLTSAHRGLDKLQGCSRHGYPAQPALQAHTPLSSSPYAHPSGSAALSRGGPCSRAPGTGGLAGKHPQPTPAHTLGSLPPAWRGHSTGSEWSRAPGDSRHKARPPSPADTFSGGACGRPLQEGWHLPLASTALVSERAPPPGLQGRALPQGRRGAGCVARPEGTETLRTHAGADLREVFLLHPHREARLSPCPWPPARAPGSEPASPGGPSWAAGAAQGGRAAARCSAASPSPPALSHQQPRSRPSGREEEKATPSPIQDETRWKRSLRFPPRGKEPCLSRVSPEAEPGGGAGAEDRERRTHRRGLGRGRSLSVC